MKRCNKIGKIGITLLFLLISGVSFIHADPVISALIDNDVYDMGDLITVKIRVENNSGLHGLFFDLAFNGDVLAFESLEEGLLVRRIPEPGSFFYARSDETTSLTFEDHVICSYSLDGQGTTTRETGILAEIHFRVIDLGIPATQYQFVFDDCYVKDGSGNTIAAAVWQNSGQFVLGSVVGDEFISISTPHENDVFYESSLTVNGICTTSSSYTVVAENIESGYVSTPLPASGGAFTFEYFPLIYGFNTIAASLKDISGNTLAVSRVRVYRSDSDIYIRIRKPVDHSLLNTDRVKVIVASSYEPVTINNITAIPLDSTWEGKSEYYAYIWLKPGFNTITATTTTGGGSPITYNDSITVYYKKDDSWFRFLTPPAGEIMNPSTHPFLDIKGEIGSRSSEIYTGSSVLPELNTVTLQVIYLPQSPWLPDRVIVDNRPALIEEVTENNQDIMTPYIFRNDFTIPLADLDAGKLEITAYKNKQGNEWDDEIHRTVFLKTDNLKIELIQPHVFDSDTFDSLKKFICFNNGSNPVFTSTELTDSGDIVLSTNVNTIEELNFNEYKVADLVETYNGTLYALINKVNEMSIYTFHPGDTGWTHVVTRKNMFGYELCDTDLGVLVGVSDYYTSGNSGLYILQEGILRNISINQPIPHVQFIKNNDGIIYLYGNGYSHLYTFNIYSIILESNSYTVPNPGKIVFANSLFIDQFILSSDGNTAIIKTTGNRITLFTKESDTVFTEVNLSSPYLGPGTKVRHVVKGEYTESDYTTYLLILEDTTQALSLMEHKKSHRFILNPVSTVFVQGEELMAAGYANDSFLFVHKQNDLTYALRSGQVLINQIDITEEPQIYQLASGTIKPENYEFFISRYGPLYIRGKDSLDVYKTFKFIKDYSPTGSAVFSYHNYREDKPDVEGLRGFSFSLDQLWIEQDMVELGFSVVHEVTEQTLINFPAAPVSELLSANDPDFSVTREYDSESGRQIITITFTSFREAVFIDFTCNLTSMAGMTPEVGGITVFKKNIIFLPRSGDAITMLPVYGFVNDPLVETIKIGSTSVPVLNDGSFDHNYPMDTASDTITVTIYCTNPQGQGASLEFKVTLFDSVNGISDISFKNKEQTPLIPDQTNTILTDTEVILVSGSYYGLVGAVVGYELYRYIGEPGNEDVELLVAGVFERIIDNPINPSLGLGSGYESGTFIDAQVPVVPGKQQLRLYVENPGGFRTEYKPGDSYIDVNFYLTQDEQRIIITNFTIEDIDPGSVYDINGIPINKKMATPCFETSDPPYVFAVGMVITGKVISLYDLEEIKVVSFNPALVFANGESETTVQIDSRKNFAVPVFIELPEQCSSIACDIGFMPTLPFLEWMKTGLLLEAEKNFENTMVVPDFSPMGTAQWSIDEQRGLEKPLRVKIDRYIPEHSTMNILVNFETAIDGELVEINPGEKLYKLMLGTKEISLTGVKFGMNRLQWRIATWDGKTISYSGSGKQGMVDFLFELEKTVTYAATTYSFPVSLLTYYNDTDPLLPGLVITKDELTYMSVCVNGTLLWEDESAVTSKTVDITEGNIKEGNNSVVLFYSEKTGESAKIEMSFLFDNEEPVCEITSYTYLPDYSQVDSLTAIVAETNLKSVDLYQVSGGENLINREPVITYMGEDRYIVYWGDLSSYSGLIKPSVTNPLRVKAVDHSGKSAYSPDFTGLDENVVRPDDEAVPVSLALYPGSNQPNFHSTGDNEYDYQNHIFPQHTKVYNDSIIMHNRNVPAGTTYNLERHDDISIDDSTVEYDSQNGAGILNIKAGGIITLGTGFEVEAGAECHLYNHTFDPQPAYTFSNTKTSEAISFGFWFRCDHESYYEPDTGHRRILTFYDNPGVFSLYLAGSGTNLYVKKQIGPDYIVILGENPPITFTDNGQDDWHYVILGIESTTSTLSLSCDNQAPVIVQVEDLGSELSAAVSSGASYFFGNMNYPEFNRHFSIAEPFYVNRLILAEELPELITPSSDPADIMDKVDRVYSFDAPDHKVSSSYFDLRMEGTGAFEDRENTVYTETEGQGSLKASSVLDNHVKINNAGYVVFTDSDEPLKSQLTLAAEPGTFTIIPISDVYNAKYYFGNPKTSHNLKKDRWYSLSGTIVEKAEAEKKAFIMMRINGVNQSMELSEGDFHFIFDNSTLMTPTTVSLCIDTETEVTIGTDIVLSEGNYILPLEGSSEIPLSRAATRFLFQQEGTIHFWYKPIIVNEAGFVNYDVVLFDSEYITIGAKDPGSLGASYYYVQIHDYEESNNVTMNSNTPVRMGWQHVQFSYNLEKDGIYNDLACLFIDGKLAAIKDTGEIPLPQSMMGILPAGDNIYLGSGAGEISGVKFAEGYLDTITMKHIYMESQYDSSVIPFLYSFTDGTNADITITPQGGITDSDLTSTIKHTLLSRDGSYSETSETESIANHGFIIAGLDAGPYNLKTRTDINGYRYEHLFTFTRNNRPRFTINELTPIIINGVETTIHFGLGYDNSYLQDSAAAEYPGIAIRITGTDLNLENEEVEFERTLYLIQDLLDEMKWYLGDGLEVWEELTVTNKTFDIDFSSVTSITPIEWEARSFYFNGVFYVEDDDFDKQPAGKTGTIPVAALDINIIREPSEYMMEVQVGADTGIGLSDAALFDSLLLRYYITEDADPGVEIEGTVALSSSGYAEIYYDDILPAYGEYRCILSLQYDGHSYGEKEETLLWGMEDMDIVIGNDRRLDLTGFSLLYLDTKENTARFYIEYDQNNITTSITYLISVSGIDTNEPVTQASGNLNLAAQSKVVSIENIPEGSSIAYLKITALAEDGLPENNIVKTAEFPLENSETAPELVMTRTVPSLITYNNVSFSWKGFVNNTFSSDITYAYNYVYEGVEKGWTNFDSNCRSLNLYNLKEGYHVLKVQAEYKGSKSPEEWVSFFVDLYRPVFHAENIRIQKLYDSDDIFYAVSVSGLEGAIEDVSLTQVTINGLPVLLNEDGSFAISEVPITLDGDNPVTINAIDRVGNISTFTLIVENYITEILFPENGYVKYAPTTLVGKLNPEMNIPMTIYLFDTMSRDRTDGDYSGWKKAEINEDFTFFIEDIYVNPGNEYSTLATSLEMHVVFEGGRIFKRSLTWHANCVTMPLDIEFSARAIEGEHEGSTVDISCIAYVDKVASWSIDFDGDGIYDDISVVQGDSEGESVKSWQHTYSSLGLVKPRVRVITFAGQYFSVTEELIIHESFKQPSYLQVDDPLALSSCHYVSGSDRLYVLTGTPSNYRIKLFEVGKNDTFISDTAVSIPLQPFGIENPVDIVALDSNHFIIASNRNGRGYIYILEGNSSGVYVNPAGNYYFFVDNEIIDIDVSDSYLFISVKNNNAIARAPIVTMRPVPQELTWITPQLDGAPETGTRCSLSRDYAGIIIADFYKQRIIRLTDTLMPLDYIGTFGYGEGEFIMPSIIKSCDTRIFIYDDQRKDIQVFDPTYQPITRIAYSTEPGYDNYLEEELLDDLADIAIIKREDGTRIYYYAILLSASSEKIAMLKLPQWEEKRIQIRNNKMVFLKDYEVFTAKPTGSDLAKILSTDSIPLIEGTVDFPAMSPDGRQIVFTSRSRLYDGSTVPGDGGQTYFYDKLYIMNVDGTGLTCIPVGMGENFEIERPVFNWNSGKIIFSGREQSGGKPDSKWKVYVYDIRTGGIVHLFECTGNTRFPSYSPDDRYVVYTTDRDGDEDIFAVDTENTDVRIEITKNNCRDSLPVWSTLYLHEITDPDSPIESRIVFITELNGMRELCYVYMARDYDSDLRVVKKSGENIGSDPDSARISIATTDFDPNYPCMSGDAQHVVFEGFDGQTQNLRSYDLKNDVLTELMHFKDSKKPAGMKNAIINFTQTPVNGNDIQLTWTPYVDTTTFYTVSYKKNSAGEEAVENVVLTKGNALIKDIEMNVTYLVRVRIEENEETYAASQWCEIKIPEVAAIPTITIDEENPYLVHLTAWTPDDEVSWNFAWIIDNQEISVGNSREYHYEFGTSGEKTIILKASNTGGTFTVYSDEVTVKIVSDIHPVIEYVLADDSSSIELDLSKSEGAKIDWASTVWVISGPGQGPLPPVTGSKVIMNLNGYLNKINVNATVKRIPVNGQMATDTIEKNMVIDLDFRDVKPVITYEADEANPNLIRFTGEHSLGNIDWYRASWCVFADGTQIHAANGASSFAYLFPESGSDVSYSVSLTIPRKNDGATETAAILLTLVSSPIQPEIDYEILTLEQGGEVAGAKILFSCSGSKGSNIDFSSARWTVPIAGSYNEQPTQIGPTAVYNLFGIGQYTLVDVSLTLMRRGGTDAVTINKKVRILAGDIPKTDIVVNVQDELTTTGTSLVFDILSSTGLYIDWEKTVWQFGTQYPLQGPSVRYEVPAGAEDTIVRYTCTVYQHNADPIVKNGQVSVGRIDIEPTISARRLSADDKNVYELSVTDTEGINIDWEKTMWSIPDGNENIIQRQGAVITHTFPIIAEAHGYPVTVNMYLKGSSKPMTGYTSIDVEGDELVPVIKWDKPADRTDKFTINFSAQSSTGSNIDWSHCVWTFGDYSQQQYGPTAVHTYPVTQEKEKYKVSLTLTRNHVNGTSETKTVYKTIEPGSDTITPVIIAKCESGTGTLFLSAAESEGRGLLLDRSIWLFEGSGDSNQDSSGGSVTASTGLDIPCLPYLDISVQTQWNNSSSSSNIHNGTTCRKSFSINDSSIVVTLYVYRTNVDGTQEGKWITKKIKLYFFDNDTKEYR